MTLANHSKYSSLIGQRVGKITVVEDFLPNRKSRVKCDCGNERIVSRYDVIRKQIKSCGKGVCRGIGKNLEGYHFSFLTVTKLSEDNQRTQFRKWLCQCICGKTIDVASNQLYSGKIKSCGCDISQNQTLVDSVDIKESVENTLYSAYNSRARNIFSVFTLTKEEFFNMIYSNCYYCNSTPLNFVTKNIKGEVKGYHVNGIDRLNNDEGYTKENCVPCCKICNYAKNDMTYNEFISWLKKDSR